jgi:predicted nucleic acid-binding protein
MAECASAVRRAIYRREVSAVEGRRAVLNLHSLGVELLEGTLLRCLAALDWAERLGQFRAYDGFYVALGEELGCDVWTADRRLANAANQAGAGWVKVLT